MRKGSGWISGFILPVVLIAVILEADNLEGPKTAYVGVLSVVPMFSAVFGTPLMTALVSVITLASAYIFGVFASDGNVTAQTVRLIIIAIVSVIAVIASITRRRMQEALTAAQVAAARAEIMREQAHTDVMTGLLNRRGFVDVVQYLSPDPRSVAVIDCDKLKEVNDVHGHVVGDEYITAIAKRLQNGVSSRDAVARWGGDEFLVFVSAPPSEAQTVIERLMARISDSAISTSAGPINATVTAGLADWPANSSLDDALRRADAALYDAKELGRGNLSVSMRLD